jgi:hypothetical protein
MNVLDKYDNIKLSAFAGHLHQIATNAVRKGMDNLLSKKHSLDPSYFNAEITLSLSELSVDEFKPLRTVTVKNTENLY